MARALVAADTADVLALLRERPLHNVFLEHVVRAGALGSVPGFSGWERDGRLAGVLMIGPQGGTALECREPAGFEALAAHARRSDPHPRHIVGSEDVTEPFWRAYAGGREEAEGLVWTRREPVYQVGAAAFQAGKALRLRRAEDRDVDELVINSARQHIEDLGDDRFSADPEGFRWRHQSDVREGRWWVGRVRGRIAFQVHVGPENAETVQIGGVYVPPDLRRRGWATGGVTSIVGRLLESHPSVLLFCAEDNGGARRVYERVGFSVRFHYRSYLLKESAPCPQTYA